MMPDFDNWLDFNGNYWTSPDKCYDTPNQEIVRGHNYIIMQFTGLHDKNGKEIYEADVFRVEEETEGLDEVYFLVITWVQEWCMFAALIVDEYHNYLREGVSALDEPLFWTYTLEDTDSRKYFLCGNIYQNPELLT